MSSKGRAPTTNIDGDVEDGTAQHGDEFTLGSWILKMKAAQHTADRPRHVILYKRSRDPVRCIAIGLIRFKEVTAGISKHLWLKNQYFGNLSTNNLHARRLPASRFVKPHPSVRLTECGRRRRLPQHLP